MSDRQVPWALGRRAFIRWRIAPGDDTPVSCWRVAIGVLEDLAIEVGRHEPIWVLDPSDEVGPPPEKCVVKYQRLGEMERIPDRMVVATALVPGQCPRCFESTRPHAPGCMVAANLENGVSPFFAPWVMDNPPPKSDGVSIFDIRALGAPSLACRGFVALGPDGPTLAPWGL